MPDVSDRHRLPLEPLNPPECLLLGPGPSNAHPDVLRALGKKQLGHLDPAFIGVMNEIQSLLRYAWQTDNAFTIAVPGTGSAAMEACIANLVECGDSVLIGVKGYFGNRMCEMAERFGAEVHRIDQTWGEAFSLDEIEKALKATRPKVLGLVHAETSTGVRQPLEGVADLCREHDCLLLLDTVTSLGGLPVHLDAWGVDAAYSGSQKCIGCPPGVAPLTFGPRALKRLQDRKHPVTGWYLDLTLLAEYWSGEARKYHHTAPINLNYGLREALRLLADEGLEARWERHASTARHFWDGLGELGLSCHVSEPIRLPTLTTVKVPAGVDAKSIASRLRVDHQIEVGGGLGALAGKVWRVGLMGHNSTTENADQLLYALKEVL